MSDKKIRFTERTSELVAAINDTSKAAAHIPSMKARLTSAMSILTNVEILEQYTTLLEMTNLLSQGFSEIQTTLTEEILEREGYPKAE